MDREIKYRAWDIANQKMISWEELMKDRHLLWEFFGNIHYLKGSPDQIYVYKRMQYLGFKDAKGVEVYEGDILDFIYGKWELEPKGLRRLGLVEYKEKAGEFIIKIKQSKVEIGFVDTKHKDIMVVGNICQHPHILKSNL